jgi:hypothetical protein
MEMAGRDVYELKRGVRQGNSPSYKKGTMVIIADDLDGRFHDDTSINITPVRKTSYGMVVSEEVAFGATDLDNLKKIGMSLPKRYTVLPADKF